MKEKSSLTLEKCLWKRVASVVMPTEPKQYSDNHPVPLSSISSIPLTTKAQGQSPHDAI